jgi:hypothetical protein
MEVALVFCDISKAFDKVSHKCILYKLNTFGISGDLLLLFECYLSNRENRKSRSTSRVHPWTTSISILHK